MNDKKKTGRALSRREFVTTTALGVGATGLGLSTRTTRAAPPPERWDAEADVVIVGYGGAGAVAAITAHDKGSKVLIIEKQPETGHTSNTRMSLAVYLCPAAVDDAIAYMQIASRVNPAMPESKDIDDDTIEVWARYMSQNNDYLKSLGAHDFSVFYDRGVNPSWPGNEAMKAYVPVDADGVKGGGIGLYNLLDRHIKFRNIGLMWDAPATRLIQNAAGEVIGILARNQGREIAIKAARAVVLTCGGFEYDEAALKTYLPLYPCVSYGNPDNTGDGIRMAVGAGADLWHMAILGGSWKARFPDFPTAFGVGFGESSLIVDQSATRFAAETQLGGYDGIWNAVQYDPANNTWPRIPAYLIFDEKRRLDSRLVPTAFGAAGPIGMYAWSEDNSAEIERGWITRANTIAGLASKLDLDADTLDRETVKFNNYARRGEDADFGRAAESMLPVDQPPYYAMLLWPGLNNTFGGPRRNARAQIIDLHGEPIPRLYSAGELGSVYVQYPQGGANLGECIAFGRIAGERAADLKVWG